MKFKIDDKSPTTCSRPALLKCIAALDKLPDGELKTSRGLATLTGIKFSTLTDIGRDVPDEYRVKNGMGCKTIYGNQKTIKAWREQQVQD